MAVRDRIHELQRARRAAHCDVPLEVPLEAPPPHDAALQQVHDILQEVERIQGWVCELAAGTGTVQRLHAAPAFHTDHKLHEEMEAAASLSAAAAAKVSGALRQLRQAGAARGRPARVARLHAACLTRQYAAALARHHRALQLLRDDRRALLTATARLANVEVTEEECEALLDEDNVALFVSNVQAETRAARLALRDLETRRDELLRLERSLQDLHQLFTQLAYLVDSQQEQIDSVEYYALQASEHVETGHQHLLKGSVRRSSARQKKLSIIMCLASGVLVVLLVLVFT